MSFDLSGEDRRKLQEAILHAYPNWHSLEQMVSFHLNENLANISPQIALNHVVFKLMEWCEARSKTSELILAARQGNPTNQKLFRFSQNLGLVSTDAPKSMLEKVVSGNTTFLDVGKWREGLTKMEWRVCRIDINGSGAGTGFLVGPDVVMTNHHVVADVIDGNIAPSKVKCRFDYKVAQGDVISQGVLFDLATEWLIDQTPHSPVDLEQDPKSGEPNEDQLDFALIRLETSAGNQPPSNASGGEPRKWIELNKSPVDFANQKVVAILQHPEALPLKLALGFDQEIKVNGAGNRIRYTVPTEGGSSGSPVFDSDWRLVALHHSGDPAVVDPQYNEAIPVSKIVERPKVHDWLVAMQDDNE